MNNIFASLTGHLKGIMPGSEGRKESKALARHPSGRLIYVITHIAN